MPSIISTTLGFIRNLIKNIFLQILSLIVLISLIGVTYAAYISINSSDIQSGDILTPALMTQIKNNLDDLNTRVGLVSIPTGAILAFNLGACPSGWTAANGSSGTPDLRGEFIRGLDSGKGVDVGRTLASGQADMIKSHTHDAMYRPSGSIISGANFQGGVGYGYITPSAATGGPETRPRNVALLYCMKQ